MNRFLCVGLRPPWLSLLFACGLCIYAARSNLSPLLVTGTMPGGLLTTTSTVENYPGFPEGVDGYELMVRMQKQAERFGARLKTLQTVEAADLSRRPFVLTVDGKKSKLNRSSSPAAPATGIWDWRANGSWKRKG